MSVHRLPEPPSLPPLLVGPFDTYRVVVDGRAIPRLTGFHDGDKIALVLDSRFSASFAEDDARQAAWLIANALAIGEGYPSMNASSKEMPFAPQMHEIELQPKDGSGR